MVPTSHRLPEAPILQVSANRRTSRNQSQLLQHGYVLFLDDTNFSFIYFTTILCAAAQHAH